MRMSKRLRDHASTEHCYVIPFDIIIAISECIYDFKSFKALGLTCRFLVSKLLIISNKQETPMTRLFDRLQDRFEKTLQFCYQVEYDMALMYHDVVYAYSHITRVLLPRDLIHRRDDIRTFSQGSSSMYDLKISVQYLFRISQGLPNTSNITDPKRVYFVRLDRLLRQCYNATLIIGTDDTSYKSPYNGITSDMSLYLRPYHPDMEIV